MASIFEQKIDTMKFLNSLNKKIQDLGTKVNFTQRIIIAVILPLILLLIAYPIASEISYSDPFDFDDTWLVWVIYLLIIGYFEINLFSGE